MTVDSLVSWLSRHQHLYLWPVGGLITLALVLGVVPLLRAPPAEEKRRHDWGWSWLLLSILAAGRWPSWLISREFNADESQLLAGAHALTHDPVFWRTLNGGTAGPLDFFALWPAGWIFGWQTYLVARLTALALTGGAIILAHQSLALVVDRRAARLASLAVVAIEALTNAPDLLHYSTELVPLFLVAGAAYAGVQRWARQGGPLWSGLGGLLLGAVPLGKVQAVPLALAMGVAWLWAEARSPSPARTRLGYLMMGACLPAILFAVQHIIAGEWHSVITSYFLFNFNYAGDSKQGYIQTLQEIWEKSVWWDSLLDLWLPGVFIWLLLMVRVRPGTDRAGRIVTWSSAIACVLTLGCIIAPSRPFLHYWQLFMVPACWLLGAVIAPLLAPTRHRAESRLVAGCVIALVGTLLVHRAAVPNAFMHVLAFCREHPRTELAERVGEHARPGEGLAIWGWTNYVYVEAGLVQATREPHMGALVEPGPLRDYFRKRYLQDLVRNGPAVFLDSVGPASLNYQDPQLAHDRNFPALAEVIRANYDLVDQIEGSRLYRRRDPVAP